MRASGSGRRSSSARLFVDTQLRTNAEYLATTTSMFAAVRAGNERLALYYDHVFIDPVFGSMEGAVDGRAAATAARALSESGRLRKRQSAAFTASLIAVALGLVLAAGLITVIRRGRALRRAMRVAEFKRLQEMVITDPLTGLRNHQAFQEDLAQELQRTGRTGVPLSLVMLDADNLKGINDAYGHQAGSSAARMS